MENENKNKPQNRQTPPPNMPPMPPQRPKGNPYMHSKYMRDEPLSEREKRKREEAKHHNMHRPPVPPPPQMRRTNLPPMPIIPPAMTKPHEDEKLDSSKGQIVSANVVNQLPPTPPMPKQRAVKMNKETTLASYETNKSLSLFRTIMIILFLFIVSTGLSFFRFKLPILPSFLEVEFSIVPEFICVVFFGPLIGAGLVIFKNLAHMAIYAIIYPSPSYVSELSNITTDLMFIILAFLIFRLAINNESAEFVARSKRIKAVAIGGAGASLLSALAIVPFDYYIIYPLFIKYFQSYGVNLDIMSYYLEKMPNLEHMWQGILIFNLPWEFGKLLSVTVIATVSYILATVNEEK